MWPAQKGRVRWSLSLGGFSHLGPRGCSRLSPDRGARHPGAWQGQSPARLSPFDGPHPSRLSLEAPTQAWEVGAETQQGLGRWGGGGLSLFKPFSGLSSLVASSSHRLLGSRSRRFCRPPHRTDPAPGLQAEPASARSGPRGQGTSPPGRDGASIPPAAPSPHIPHPPSGPGPPGGEPAQARRSHGGGPGAGEPRPKKGHSLGPGSGVFSSNSERP